MSVSSLRTTAVLVSTLDASVIHALVVYNMCTVCDYKGDEISRREVRGKIRHRISQIILTPMLPKYAWSGFDYYDQSSRLKSLRLEGVSKTPPGDAKYCEKTGGDRIQQKSYTTLGHSRHPP